MTKRTYKVNLVLAVQKLTYFYLIMCALWDIYRAISRNSALPLVGATVYLSMAWGYWYWNRIQLRRLAATRTKEVSGEQ